MKKTQVWIVAVGLLCFLGNAKNAVADTFKSTKECVIGMRVADSAGNTGKVVRVEGNGGTMCFVYRDDLKREYAYIFWMLHAEDGGKAADAKPQATAPGEPFKSARECMVGKRVTDSSGKSGTVTHVEGNGGTLCTVMVDESKKEHAYIFWMLHTEGANAPAIDKDKLVPGVYECFGGGHYTFMDMRILSANTYESAGEKGRFRVEPSGTIVFESGPLMKNHGKLLRGPAIGLNADGGSFYATTCELNRNKK
jgi:hypothetical protein